jgi:hypothetical protein
MNFAPARRFLGGPAWAWVVLPLILLVVIKIIGPPGPLPEPSDMSLIIREGLLFTRTGDSFGFVPWGQHELVKPLWAVSMGFTTRSAIEWGLGKDASGFHLGLYKRTGQWRWSLDALRFDEEGRRKSPGEPSLSQSELQKLLPLLVAELNRRSGEKHWGDVFAKALGEGRETSSYACIQNVLILSAWLSVLVALSAVGAMFFAKNAAARIGRVPPVSSAANPSEPR